MTKEEDALYAWYSEKQNQFIRWELLQLGERYTHTVQWVDIDDASLTKEPIAPRIVEKTLINSDITVHPLKVRVVRKVVLL